MDKEYLIRKIEESWDNRDLIKNKDTQKAIRDVIEKLDKGKIRVAEKNEDGWIVNEWMKNRINEGRVTQ